MSVDLSISVGVGFQVPAERIDELAGELNLSESEVIYEQMYKLVKDEPFLSCGSSGTFYAVEPKDSAWVAVKRTVLSGDYRDAEAGYFELSYELTEEELAALERAAEATGVRNPRIGPFFSVLWH